MTKCDYKIFIVHHASVFYLHTYYYITYTPCHIMQPIHSLFPSVYILYHCLASIAEAVLRPFKMFLRHIQSNHLVSI